MLGQCAILAIFRVMWMERNRRIFEEARDEDMDLIWDKVRYWASV